LYQDKVALVTGSGRGIGRAIALHLAKLGADVVINFFRNRQPAEDTANDIHQLGRRALVVKANVGDIEQLDTLFNQISQQFGGLDYFIHNAASGYNRPTLQQKPRGWEWTMNINARSFLFASQLAAPMMEKRGGGAIIAISSPGATRVLPDYSVVGASKAAIESLVRYLAVEFASMNISVNGISPGMVLTDALQHFEIINQSGIVERTINLTPAGRLVTPEDIAGVVAFLCSPQANMIRGQIISVDGGITLLGPGVEPD
jgi:enoyl-[acyl-carrier protein] reductase III